MTDETSSVTAAVAGKEPKLWAGKYKTAEDLEEAYKHTATVVNENKELKEKYESVTKIPEKYNVPSGFELRETEITEIQTIAKNAGLTQEQFERTAREMETRIKEQRVNFEKAKSEIGEQKLALLQEHIKKTYPESLQQTVLTQVIKDKKAMDDLLKERDSNLNSTAPGMDKSGGAPTKTYDGQAEVMKAAQEWHRNPTRANKEKYINLCNEVGNERYKKEQR